jgi:cobalt-zinc-cadmium resistance protein CzcA
MRIERALMTEIPEIHGIMSRAGADELGIDPVGLNETDMFLTLVPKNEWRGPDQQWLLGELRRVLETIPGIDYAFAQPIDMRVQEMIIGARGDVVVKVFGDDLNRVARDVAAQLRDVPGSVDVFALRNAARSCRCSPCRAWKARSSVRCLAPMPMPCSGRSSPPSP